MYLRNDKLFPHRSQEPLPSILSRGLQLGLEDRQPFSKGPVGPGAPGSASDSRAFRLAQRRLTEEFLGNSADRLGPDDVTFLETDRPDFSTWKLLRDRFDVVLLHLVPSLEERVHTSFLRKDLVDDNEGRLQTDLAKFLRSPGGLSVP